MCSPCTLAFMWLSLNAPGCATGVAIKRNGESLTVPIHESYVLPHATLRWDLAFL